MIAARAFQVKPSIPFQFVAVPTEILRRSDLSGNAKLLAGVILDNARGSRSGSCRLTNEALGARIGRSAASVKRLLAELEAAGLVRRETLAEGRVRTSVRPTWVAQESTTGQASAAQDRPTGGSETNHRVAQDRPTIQTPPSEPSLQTGSSLSLSGEEDPKPTPAEIAAAMRAMVAGKYAPAMFEASGGYSEPPTVQPRDAYGIGAPSPDRRKAVISNDAFSTKGVFNGNTPDVRALFGRVGYSAVAAIERSRPPRKGRDQQLAELAATRRLREARCEGAPTV